jgi:hypothetical protein
MSEIGGEFVIIGGIYAQNDSVVGPESAEDPEETECAQYREAENDRLEASNEFK